MDNNDNLTSYYDQLKSELSSKENIQDRNMINVGRPNNGQMAPNAIAWRNMAAKESEKLKDDCYKRIILDIYVNTLPIDKSYIDGNKGVIKSDVDNFLTSKDMTPTQYLTSAHEKTNAPLLEYVIRAGKNIQKKYMKEADEILKNAQANDAPLAPPSVEDEDIDNHIVDITKDTEYETFIDELKKKTIDKIVDDISNIINDKKDEDEMVFNPSTVEPAVESTVSIGIDYISSKLLKENVLIGPNLKDDIICLAIREATLNQLDITFKQPGSDLKSFGSKMRYGKGVVINESTVKYIKEAAEEVAKRFEPLYKETDGNKYDVSNHEKVDKSGNKTPMNDADAKKVLDEKGYKDFKDKQIKK